MSSTVPSDTTLNASRRAQVGSESSRAQVWTDYWASGAPHSCAGSYAGNYAGAIAAFWRRVFAELPHDATVLDLCCGNAPLSRLLLDERPSLLLDGGRIDAVDAAAIAPGWIETLPATERLRIGVHAGVDARRLPFEANFFDLCMSQYGIEYVGQPAMTEARRVLRPGAWFAAVLHHREALPVRIAREEQEHLAWLLQPEGLLALTRELLEPMARSATAAGQATLRGDARAKADRAAFNARLAELELRLPLTAFPDVLHETRIAVTAALQRARTEGVAAGGSALTQLEKELKASALRQHELIECALDERGVRVLLEALGEHTRKDQLPQIDVLAFESGEIAGWAVQARRH